MELAELAKKQIVKGLEDDFPAPITNDRELEIYLEAKRLMFRRTAVIGGVIALAIFAGMFLAFMAALMLFLDSIPKF